MNSPVGGHRQERVTLGWACVLRIDDLPKYMGWTCVLGIDDLTNVSGSSSSVSMTSLTSLNAEP